jgi:hypothetical protein
MEEPRQLRKGEAVATLSDTLLAFSLVGPRFRFWSEIQLTMTVNG